MTDVETKTAAVFRKLAKQKIEADQFPVDEAVLDLSVQDFAFDSLEKMELVMLLEDTFAITLDEEDMLGCEKISDLVRLIQGIISSP